VYAFLPAGWYYFSVIVTDIDGAVSLSSNASVVAVQIGPDGYVVQPSPSPSTVAAAPPAAAPVFTTAVIAGIGAGER
jgi:hypothetical protein